MVTSNLIGLFENVWYCVVISCPICLGTTSLFSWSSIRHFSVYRCTRPIFVTTELTQSLTLHSLKPHPHALGNGDSSVAHR